jgi:hypothetical protein
MPAGNTQIVTLHSALNFGAALQAYALRRAIADTGARADIIDYGPRVPDHAHYVSGRTLTKPAKFALYALQLGGRREQARRFREFQKAHLSLTHPYPDLATLKAVNIEADILMCGSDQIWNPRLPFDPVFFLQFGDPRCRRIAYAPSFGIPEVAPHFLPELRDYLASFNVLSCREQSGAILMEHLTGRQVFHAVDPTLLLEASAWQELAAQAGKIKLPADYILVYGLQDSPYLAEAVLKARKETGLPVVTLSAGLQRPKHLFHHLVRSAGPLEFLSLMLRARMVVTNSMHGTIFSLIFEKPAIFPRHTTSSERINDLFARLGISHARPIISMPSPESAQLRPMREKLASASRQFLHDAIHGDANSAVR